ncbi:hypothetical protein VE00_01635 [Pseudogymnoascus sp. WSF 3629]|nr:hypothetical protein VE00_01635 [Pseudogymnoascus sp. WSF 3629]
MSSLPSGSRATQQREETGYSTSTKAPLLLSTNDSIIPDRSLIGGNGVNQSPLSQNASYQTYGKFNEEWDASQRGSSIIDSERYHLKHTPSVMSQGDPLLPRRGGTLKKKASLRRSSSRRSSRAGSVRSLALQPEPSDEIHSAFYSPVPTSGNPTEALANRFTAWRKLLKDLILYFREIQNGYEHRGKSILKLSNVANNISAPENFLQSNGINEAMQILRDYHKQAITESSKARMIQEDVVQALTGLRSDLQQKIKEIKNLSGDFKNSVDREMDTTRRAVRLLGDSLGQSDIDASQMTGKQDPYLLRLAVERQLERQIDEENYLHQAYLNLETSGRELESIVVGEIQKAYNAYTGILKRDADEAYTAIQNLRTGPIAMPRDYEWNSFIESDEHFVDPRVPMRSVENIHYPGRDHELAQEVRAGLLERKSKYLKSYTAGWYVLSPTHLHEFKTADKSQAPIMSLYLPEQKLGSHSSEGGSSNKFMLKGRQTGSLHRGHSWVFRAESYDTMMAWYDDIKSLTESAPQERNAFVRSHARSFSAASQRAASVSSDGVMDEEDEEPFSTVSNSAVVQVANKQENAKRPEPGGRFPSDIQVDPSRGLQVPLSPSSANSSLGNNEIRNETSTTSNVAGGGSGEYFTEHRIISRTSSHSGHGTSNGARPSHATQLDQFAVEDGLNPYTYQPIGNQNPQGSPVTNKKAVDEKGLAEHSDYQQIPAPERQFNQSAPNSQVEYMVANNDPALQEHLAQTGPTTTRNEAAGLMTTSQATVRPVIPETANANTHSQPYLDYSSIVPSVAGLNTITAVNQIAEQRPEYPESKSIEQATSFPNTTHESHSFAGPRCADNDTSSKTTHMHIPGEYPSQTPTEE